MIYVIYVIYAVIGIFLYLIINWLVNNSRFRILEGIETATPAPAPAPAAAAPAAAAAKPGIKCPEDCTSVKELQSNLNTASKKVTSLEANIDANNVATQQHAESINNLNKAIAELQTKGTDE
jgi:hypothetical protein